MMNIEPQSPTSLNEMLLYIYVCVCVCIYIFMYCDLSYYVSSVGNPDIIWFLTCVRHKTQEVLKVAMVMCIIVMLQFLLKYIALDKEVALS